MAMPASSIQTLQHVCGRRAPHAGGAALPACSIASRNGCRLTAAPARLPWKYSDGRNGWTLTAAAAERCFAQKHAAICPSCQCRQSFRPEGSGRLPALRRLGRGAAAWKRRPAGPCQPGLSLAQCSVGASLALGLGDGGGGSLIGHSGGGGGGGGGGRHGRIPSAARAPAATSGSEDVILLDVTGEMSLARPHCTLMLQSPIGSSRSGKGSMPVGELLTCVQCCATQACGAVAASAGSSPFWRVSHPLCR